MRRLLAIAALIAGAAAPAVADAAPRLQPAAYQDQGRSARQAPLSQVLAMLSSRYPGRPLDTRLGDAGGRRAYFVQWQLENGRVVVFVVDAETGQILGRQGG
jgi:uncharacterized membrane protein YkoI